MYGEAANQKHRILLRTDLKQLEHCKQQQKNLDRNHEHACSYKPCRGMSLPLSQTVIRDVYLV